MIKGDNNSMYYSSEKVVTKEEAKILVLQAISYDVNGTLKDKINRIETFNLSGITVNELFEVNIK